MSSLFDVGKSAVQSYRQSLAVTGQNIANINTDGYKRREADLEEVSGLLQAYSTTTEQFVFFFAHVLEEEIRKDQDCSAEN